MLDRMNGDCQRMKSINSKNADFEELLIGLLKTASLTHAINMESDQTAKESENVANDEVVNGISSIEIVAANDGIKKKNETRSSFGW